MPSRSSLTPHERGFIDGLKSAGCSNREIARRMGRSHKVVDTYVKDPAAYGTRKHPGRPKKTTERERRAVLRQASNSDQSARQIQAHLQLNICPRSVLRIIKKSNFLVRRRMRKAPFLTTLHRKNRLEFARAHMKTDWSKIVWSDEKKFNLDGPDGNRFYWHDLRKDKVRFSRRNFRGGGILVWACFGANGRIKLVFAPKRIKSATYIHIMKRELLPFWRKNRRRNLIYMQDNASPHVSKYSMNWFQKKRISLLKWPANSPNLNPQENIWGILARRVYENNTQYSSVKDLKEAIVKAWHTIDQRIVDNLVLSMDTRMYHVILNNGGPVDY